LGNLRLDPALVPGRLDDGDLDLLDRHGVLVDAEDAGRLARRRAQPPGELGEVVGGVQAVDRVAPTSRYTRSFQSGIRLPSGQPLLQNGMPQSMQRPAWVWSVSEGNSSYTSFQSLIRTGTGRRVGHLATVLEKSLIVTHVSSITLGRGHDGLVDVGAGLPRPP
jgi:hypothetical protein